MSSITTTAPMAAEVTKRFYFVEDFDGVQLSTNKNDAIMLIATRNDISIAEAAEQLDSSSYDEPIEAGDDCFWCETNERDKGRPKGPPGGQ